MVKICFGITHNKMFDWLYISGIKQVLRIPIRFILDFRIRPFQKINHRKITCYIFFTLNTKKKKKKKFNQYFQYLFCSKSFHFLGDQKKKSWPFFYFRSDPDPDPFFNDTDPDQNETDPQHWSKT